jgi:hypothetical protein
MAIAGISVILLLGIANLLLLVFQLLTGLRYVKLPFRFHRRAGLVLVFLATAHGLLAILANL